MRPFRELSIAPALACRRVMHFDSIGIFLPPLSQLVRDMSGDPTALTVAEGGTGTYGLKLTRAPTSDVTVTVLGAGGAVTAGPAMLTFTADNWDTAQTVTDDP